uniref:helix-turn-helix domain-containing protein n=1 Tax=Acetatifactor sp. TaxID=1872090 RepID=UPI004056A957
MLHENLKNYRRNKGMSQEQVALQVHVTRQTVSKWEKGISVPDAETLIKIAEVFDVPVGELIGETVEKETVELSDVAEQLARINEMFAMRIQQQERIKKQIVGIAGVVILVLFIGAIYGSWNEMWYEFGQNLYHWLH